VIDTQASTNRARGRRRTT